MSMSKQGLAAISTALAALALCGGARPDWRTLDPAQTLVIDTTAGRMIVEMRPDFAPLAVARVKLLAREKVYDGLLFHRVIDHFVDQTGNPNNHDGGVSQHPDLAPEFTFRLKPGDGHTEVTRSSDAVAGFVGATPFQAVSPLEAAQKPKDGFRAWGAYCPGVAGMGRQEAPGSGNSEIFFMRDAARRLDRDYTVWGRVVVGLPVVRAMAVGEPPAKPDRMLRVRLAADLPDAPKVQVLDERGPAFAALVARERKAKGADFSVCDIEIPARVVP
jgi:peptidylprolyl isomerase